MAEGDLLAKQYGVHRDRSRCLTLGKLSSLELYLTHCISRPHAMLARSP